MNRQVGRLRTWAAIGAASVLLAGCGGDDDAADDATDAPAPAETAAAGSATDPAHDVWTAELDDGSTLTVRLRAPIDDPAVAAFEEFRQTADGPDLVWIVGEVAVPAEVAEGTGSGRYLTFVTGDGDPMTDDPDDPTDGVTAAYFACSLLTDWLGTAPAEDVLAAYNDLYSGPCAGNPLSIRAASGTTTTYVLAHPAPLPQFDELLAGLITPLTPG
ncbi:MAG TPA: hypothetical protein VNQ73_06500 [Ilumatobacter sp.]|nr:hypothetical protein [Ilumatobacter sp.]